MANLQALPPATQSAQDIPLLLPGTELSQQQNSQAAIAQIVAISLAVAEVKKAAQDVAVNAAVQLFRSMPNLATTTVSAFLDSLEIIILESLFTVRSSTWEGVYRRLSVMNIPFPAEVPGKEHTPPDLRFSRGTPIKKAYRRIFDELQQNLKRTADDPIIKDLINQHLTAPKKQASDISSDAVDKPKKKSSAESIFQPYQPKAELTIDEVEEIVERFARQKAEERLERMLSHDIQSEFRNTHQLAMRSLSNDAKKKVVGYRRIVHPELSASGKSCGLCIVASTHRYTRGDLLPIHAGCNCEVAEIFKVNGEEIDPGMQINLEDLDVFYRDAGESTHGWDLKRERYKVVDHPEFGPTLVHVPKNKKEQSMGFEPVPFTSRGFS